MYHCSHKFSDFSSLIFSQVSFEDTISGFHKTNKNTLSWWELSVGVLYSQLPVLPLVEKNIFIFIDESSLVPLTKRYELSVNAHIAFLQSCNTVAFLQEDECIFVGWIFTFTHVCHTTKNPLIYLSYLTSDFTATCCSKVQYDTTRFFYRIVKM